MEPPFAPEMQEECQLGVMEKWPHLEARRAKRERSSSKDGTTN
jgi:hypothetical protein